MLKYEIHHSLYNLKLKIKYIFFGIMAEICSLLYSDFFKYFYWVKKQINILKLQKDMNAEWLISMQWYK
jgi:hypothetical protein